MDNVKLQQILHTLCDKMLKKTENVKESIKVGPYNTLQSKCNNSFTVATFTLGVVVEWSERSQDHFKHS